MRESVEKPLPPTTLFTPVGVAAKAKIVATHLRGTRAGERQELRQESVSFGRREESDVRFPESDAKASGRHAELRRDGGRWLLSDCGSMNGTWIGGARIGSDHEVVDGVVVEFGSGGPLVRLDIVSTATLLPLPTVIAAVTKPEKPASRTAIFRTIVDDAVKHSGGRLKVMILGLAGIILIGAVLVGWVLLRQTAETERLAEGTEAVRRLSQAAETIAERYDRSLFILISESDGEASGFCTAFAVSTDGMLVTNAHCVRALKDLRAGGARIVARMNRASGSRPEELPMDPDRSYEVRLWKEHPDYDGSAFSPDVALIGLDLKGDSLPVVAQLAAPEVARQLQAGQAIFTMGFPGQVMNEARPMAELRAAVVSRLTTPANTPGDEASTYVVWHSALTSKGTSGSPIFDAAGRVVAVNNGGLSARELFMKDPKTGELRTEVISEASGLNFAIRSDQLDGLLHSPPTRP